MSTPTSPILENPDPGKAYQDAYDALGKAYWEASDLQSKDLIFGAQQAAGDILTAINQQQLLTNTALFIQLTPKIKATNAALKQIQDEINKITKNIDTASTVLSAINKVLTVFPVLV